MNRTCLAVVAAAIVLIAIGLVVLPRYLNPPEPGGSVDGFMGLRCNRTADGNWTIYETGGSHPISEVRLMVINASTGSKTVDVKLSDILPNKNNPDAVFNDSNANKKFDAGDSIILKATSQNIQPGYKVQFTSKDGNTVIGTVKELQ